MNHFIFIIAIAFFQEVPFKPTEEFEVKLDYAFRQRPAGDHNTVRLGEPKAGYGQKAGAGVLPYLVLNIKLLVLPEEKMRIRITNNFNERPVYKKVSTNSLLVLDMGFTADIVDRVTAHEYILTIINSEKMPVDRIVIVIDEDGSFFVNGEKRGKF